MSFARGVFVQRLICWSAVATVIATAVAELSLSPETVETVLRPAAVLLLVGCVFWVQALYTSAKTQKALTARIAAHEQTECDLARSEERLSVAQAVARVGTYDLDTQTGSSTWSDTLRSLYGVSPDAPTGYEAFLALVHDDDRDRVRATIDQAWTRGGEFEVEYRLPRPEGTVWMLSRGRMFTDERGEPLRAIGVAMDITERKRADEERAKLEQQLRQAQKLEAVGRLAGGVAHDFNNLLLAIRGYGELAGAMLAAGEDPAEEVAEVVAVADRATALTRQLLAFSRRQVLVPEVLDLNEVIVDMTRLLTRMVGEDVALETELADDGVFVNADRGQLEQVLANLAVNARDAMPNGGRLTVEVGTVEVRDGQLADLAPGTFAVLSLTDTGCGMTPEMAAQIFEPFFTTKEDGTGLGLATVHGIVQQSGGTIEVASQRGKGTTFKIYFPLARSAAAAQSRQPGASSDRRGGELILLVEDSPQVQTLVRRMLEERGYRVLTAGDGYEALRLAEAEMPVDLLLTDLVLPGSSGREIARQLRERDPRLAVLFTSGYSEDSAVHGDCDESTAFLQKPFSADDLAARLRELLDRSAIGV